MTVGQRIKAARKEAGMTQADLAAKVGTTNHCINKWETGVRNPKFSTLSSIAAALGVNVNRLLQTPMTNADRFRAMSDEELAEFLCASFSCYGCPSRADCDKSGGQDCDEIVLEWLKSPAKEDAR